MNAHEMRIDGDRVYCAVCGWGRTVPHRSVVDSQQQLTRMGELFREHARILIVVNTASDSYID